MEPITAHPKYITRRIDTIKDLLEQSVALYNDKNAFFKKIKEIDIAITYKKYKEDIFSLGTQLLNFNIENEKIVLLTENRYETCVSFMATVCGKGIAVPIDYNLKVDEIVSIINKVNAKIIVFSNKSRGNIKEIKTKCSSVEYMIDIDSILDDEYSHSFLKLIEQGNKVILNGDNSYAKLEMDIDSDVVILPLSGNDLLVTLSNRNVVSSIMSISSMIGMSTKDKVLSFYSICNIYELIYSFLMINYEGGTIFSDDSEKSIIEKVKEVKPTLLILSNEDFNRFYEDLLKNIGLLPQIRKVKMLMFFSNLLRKVNVDRREKIFSDVLKKCGGDLRKIIVFSNNIDNFKLKELSSIGINVFWGYGFTETSGFVTLNKYDGIKQKSIGISLLDTKIRINNSGKMNGEILIKSDTVTKGYYDDKKATSERIRNEWFHTGDVGYKDKKGYFYLIGKKKVKRSKR